MPRRILGTTLFALLMASCTDDIQPAVAPIATHALGLSQTPAPSIDSQWWKTFGDPQLDRLVETSISGNPSLAQALARLRGAHSLLASARSQQYPQVTFDANEQRDQFSSHYVIPPPFGGTTQWIGTVAGNLSWDIDLWGRQEALVNKAHALGEAAAFDAAGARLAVEGAVADAYVALGEAYRLADVARATVEERAHLVALARQRAKDGLDSQVELVQAQTLLDEARKTEAQADSNRELVIHAIAALMGRGANTYPVIARPPQPLEAALALPSSLPADLLARRPDIASARARIEAATQGRAAAHAAFYPDVNLLATAGFAAIGLNNLLTLQSAQYGAGPALHLPIFDAGKLRADYESATADLDLAVADYNAAVTQAVRDTSDRLTQIRSLDLQSTQQARFNADAALVYRLAESRYRTGLANQLTLLNAESLLLEARQQEAVLDAARTSERIHLILAIGGGFDASAPVVASTQHGQQP